MGVLELSVDHMFLCLVLIVFLSFFFFKDGREKKNLYIYNSIVMLDPK